MSFLRSASALCALSLCAAVATAQGTTPAVSTVVAFSYSNPVGNLVLGADGALYGVAAPATGTNGGLVYRTTTDGSQVSTLYQLSATDDGTSPQAGLTLGSDGVFYGTTKFGRISEA
ncbi:MAG: choice-of-anchor tandem repeat GloVer-containing protein, partial [Steroidobacteraceae bacterium]